MAMNADLRKVFSRVKDAQAQLQNILKDNNWVEDARKYAERQGKEVKKLIKADVTKMKTFLERERKELEKIQKQLPNEVEKFRTFVNGQKKEFERLLENMRKKNFVAPKRATKSKKKASTSKTGAKKKSSAKKASTS